MGILDSVIGALGQGGVAGTGGSGGGGNAALLQAVIAMLGNGGQAGGGGAGLGGLLEQFQRAGLGDVANSWVSPGQNMPVSPDQLGSALGGDQIASMASQLGMGQSDLLGQLSQMLPQVVDHLTPNGQVPQGDMGDLGSLLGGLLGR
jgi:uncharacterized protein YidB (DUF937 family)